MKTTFSIYAPFIRVYCSIAYSQAFVKHSTGASGGHKTQQTPGSAGVAAQMSPGTGQPSRTSAQQSGTQWGTYQGSEVIAGGAPERAHQNMHPKGDGCGRLEG